MTKQEQAYVKSDWIVHNYHGVGQIKAVETKTIAGKKGKYFRVKTKDREFWIPVEDSQTSNIRPLVSHQELLKTLKIFSRPPEELEKDYRARQRQIDEFRSKGTLMAVCRLVRDLWARRMQKSLNDSEERTLEFYQKILLEEWSLSAEVPLEDANRSLKHLLKECITASCVSS